MSQRLQIDFEFGVLGIAELDSDIHPAIKLISTPFSMNGTRDGGGKMIQYDEYKCGRYSFQCV